MGDYIGNIIHSNLFNISSNKEKMSELYKILGILFLLAYNAALFDYYRKNENYPIERYKILNDSSELEMGDFQSYEEIWSSSAAVIDVGLALVKNPILEAKAIIDRHESWYRKAYRESEELFTHEVYHVKLAQAIAKDFNKRINDYKYDGKKIKSRLSLHKRKLNQLQSKYDLESNHSRNKTMQNYWEYKIDSMFNQDESYELFNNVLAFFPEKPSVNYLIYHNDTFLGYSLKKKEIEFTLWDLKETYLDTLMIENWSVNFLGNQGLTNIIINYTSSHPNAILENHSEDSLTMKIFKDKLLIDKNNRLYYARYSYPNNSLSDSIYQKMGNQYFNSIKIDSN
ncbi:MAG: hypothetical protein ACJAWX_001134 [Algoriphagus sp.]